jgi:hypothetical protein
MGQRGCKSGEHVAGCAQLLEWNFRERLCNASFDRSFGHHIEPSAIGSQHQKRAPLVPRIRPSANQLLPLETGEDARERTRMNVQHSRETAGRNSRKAPHDAEDESLRSRHAEVAFHTLRRSLQAVVDSPYDPQKIKHIAERGFVLRGQERAGSRHLELSRQRTKSRRMVMSARNRKSIAL